MTPSEVRSALPQLGYLVVSGRRGPIATPAFFGISGERYWIVARRQTAKVRSLVTCDRASLLMSVQGSWKLVTGHARVVDPLRPSSLFHALPDLVCAPGGLLDHVRANRRSLLDLWTARPKLFLEIAKAAKVLICLRPRAGGEQMIQIPTGSAPVVVVSTEVDSFPVAAPARQEPRNVVRLTPGCAAAILPKATPAGVSITCATQSPAGPNGAIAFGNVTPKTSTEFIFQADIDHAVVESEHRSPARLARFRRLAQ